MITIRQLKALKGALADALSVFYDMTGEKRRKFSRREQLRTQTPSSGMTESPSSNKPVEYKWLRGYNE